MDNTRWFKYDRDYLCVNKLQFVPVIFEPPCILAGRKMRIGVFGAFLWFSPIIASKLKFLPEIFACLGCYAA
jgi:hypothetical protein